jgi:hypothetical protein
VLYKVSIGRDQYLGTAEEVVAWMSKAIGAPVSNGDANAFMSGIRARMAERGLETPIDDSTPSAFLASLSLTGLVRVEERPEASAERVDPREALGEGPVAFGEGVEADDLEADVLDPLEGEE